VHARRRRLRRFGDHRRTQAGRSFVLRADLLFVKVER
jgi:hypothetical protein